MKGEDVTPAGVQVMSLPLIFLPGGQSKAAQVLSGYNKAAKAVNSAEKALEAAKKTGKIAEIKKATDALNQARKSVEAEVQVVRASLEKGGATADELREANRVLKGADEYLNAVKVEEKARAAFMTRAKLGGEATSAKNLHLFENRGITVEQYIGKFRKGGIKEVLPAEAKIMTVEEALRKGQVGNVNVRKLILDTRDKFVK